MKYNIIVRAAGGGNIKDDSYATFGDFLAAKRRTSGLSTYELARLVGITQAYYSDIERNRRNPPGIELFEKMASVLNIPEAERNILYDLAGKGRSVVSPDLHDYIMQNEIVREAIRLAKKTADAGDWQRFIESLKQKQK